MEHWEYLKPDGLRFVWDDTLFRPGTDSFLLSSLPKLSAGLRVCDLGCGTVALFAAEKATSELTAFMIRHTSGYICVGMTGEDLDRLHLPPMTVVNEDRKGTAYAVVDGVDGRTHHIRLPHLDAAGDSRPGSIVELRAYEDARGDRRVAIAIRSDLDLQQQVRATGATWLDRQAIAREPVAMSEGGFGAEVREAMQRRADHLVGEGLADRQGQRITFARNLIDTLRRRELDAVADKLSSETGQPSKPAGNGEYVAGAYRQRLALASGRFAMIDDGLGFQLVPWSPSLDKHLGKHVSGVARADGGVDWSFGRKRGLGL